MRFVSPLALWVLLCSLAAAQPELIGHWPLQDNLSDASPSRLKFQSTGVTLEANGPTKLLTKSARFDGQQSVINVDTSSSLQLATQSFSMAAWVNAADLEGDVPGDLVSQYDPASRTGFHLGLYSHGGVTNAQSNFRQLHFGIDQGKTDQSQEGSFTDHGRLGNAVYVFSLCVHDEKLYASTCHPGDNEAGHVFRFEGGEKWTDLGSPDKANSISAMAVFEGSLYVASSKYRLAGSSLEESRNTNFGGRVFRLGPNEQWIDCGNLSPETEGIGSLVEFRGKLYAGSLYKPAGFFRYEGEDKWTACETPDGKRVEAMTVFNGSLYASSYDAGSVFRFDGNAWHDAGKIPNATQTYGFAVHQGSLFVSEWPQAHVFRFLGGTEWEDTGKLGEELEAMPLLVYNGKMYGGTLPLAEIYRYDGPNAWSKIARVDHTPDVRFRRAWSMAVYQGRLFVGALPSGRVLSFEAGRNATYDKALPTGWHHVAAVRDADHLQLYVDGKAVSRSATFKADDFNLTNDRSLQIGMGAQDHFRGHLADVRLYRGALSPEDVKHLASGVSSDGTGKSSDK
jgi:hypothetical protein